MTSHIKPNTSRGLEGVEYCSRCREQVVVSYLDKQKLVGICNNCGDHTTVRAKEDRPRKKRDRNRRDRRNRSARRSRRGVTTYSVYDTVAGSEE